jgi:thioredoxin-dependent peroxiredoxin
MQTRYIKVVTERKENKMYRTAFFVLLIGVLGGCKETVRPDGGTGLLPVGSAAPNISGIDQDGRTVRLSDAVGAPAVVYFYPKDQTPGCTKEACAFRDAWSRYEAAGVKLFGVSDSEADSHKKFADKYSLPFPLIADTDRVWGTAFGVKTAMGMYQRVSFLIDKSGKISKVYDDVDPGIHAMQILEDIQAQQAASQP